MLDIADAEVLWLTKGLPASRPLSAAGLSLWPLRSPLESRAFAANHHRAQKEQPPIQIFLAQGLILYGRAC